MAANEILGIDLELQGKILQLIKFLIEENKPLTGTIIMVKDIGPGFCWGVTDLSNLKKAIEYFHAKKPEISILETVVDMPASELMRKIHLLRDKAGLPGILNYLKSQTKAA